MTVAQYLLLALVLCLSAILVFTKWGRGNRITLFAVAIIGIGGSVSAYYLMEFFYQDARQILVSDSTEPDAQQSVTTAQSEQEAKIETAASTAPAESGAGNTTTVDASNQLTLSYEGYGVIRFGDTVNQVEQVLGEPIIVDRETAEDLASCYRGSFAQYPGLVLMVEEGIITRADADASVQNALGISIGDGYDATLAKYPDAKIELQKYVIDGHEIALTMPGMDGYAIVLLEEDKKITAIRAGIDPSVYLVESCS